MKFQPFFLIILAFLVCAQTWYVDTVDSTSSAGAYNSLALDSSDNPHTSFSYEDNDNLMYAYYNPLWIEDDPILSEYSLIGSSPNPASGNVSMHFSIPKPSLVGFTVFNIAGRLISEIQRNEYSEGSHFIQLNELAPGIYFCRMLSEDFTATRQFVVLE